MILFQSIVKPLDVQTNKEASYLVSASDKPTGNPLLNYENVVGVRMKRAADSFWLDSTYEDNIRKFDEDIKEVKKLLERKQIVIFSPSLLGEELNVMETSAPKTARYLRDKLRKTLSVNR
jgi:hypothetical protein|tara:strand:- start:4563 stop:4922 length:360 start_codon:yes stop_codon:yes gene_type:complete